MSDLVGFIASGKDGKEAAGGGTPPAHNGNGGNEGGAQ